MCPEDFEHIHLEGIALRDGDRKQYCVADGQGYVLYVTAQAATVDEAREKSESLIRQIYFPRMMYRNDIGINFVRLNLGYL